MYWKNVSITFLLSTFGSLAFGQDKPDRNEFCAEEGNCPAGPPAITNYAKIYEEIWDADQNLNGVPGILTSDSRDENRGYVVVEEPLVWDNDKNLNILSEVVIPKSKRATYDLVKKLFDNYTLDQSKPETSQTAEEKAEIAAFINAIKDTEPMKLARQFIESENGAFMTDEEWYDSIHKTWFEIYDYKDSTPQRSGFEHVFVGEMNGSKLGGYHFWYKYFLDDKAIDGYANGKDSIDYLGTRYFSNPEEGVSNPNAVTLRYELDAFDYENGATQKLFKSTGGFDVGCSPEGLIALGMACFNDPRSTKSTVINNVKLELRLFKAGPGESSINTFYSMFKGLTVVSVPIIDTDEPAEDLPPTSEDLPPTTGVESAPSDVRILAALVNPDGADQGKETVSLINTSNRSLDLKGWTIAGNNGNAYKLVDAKFDAGEIRTIKLPARDAQLTNKSAKITLKDANSNIIQVVNYAKKDIKSGYTVVF